MQLYSRIVVNLLVILVTTLVNLLVIRKKVRKVGEIGGKVVTRRSREDPLALGAVKHRSLVLDVWFSMYADAVMTKQESVLESGKEKPSSSARSLPTESLGEKATAPREELLFPTFLGELDSRY